MPDTESDTESWPRVTEKPFVEATLLNYDALKSQIIFDVEVPLLSGHKKEHFRILPRVDELLKAVKAKLATLKLSPAALSWRFLGGNVVPRSNRWNGQVDSRDLDPSQLSVIQGCLSRDISFVWGPPGTGKTHTLGRLIATAAIEGKRIIATSIANVAVDQLAFQLVRALEGAGPSALTLLNGDQAIRFGHPRLPEVTREPRLFPHREEIQELRKRLHQALDDHRKIPERDTLRRALSQKVIKDLRDEIRRRTKEIIDQARVILTTAIQVCIEPLLTDVGFDVMVVDEASMMPIPILACMGLVGRDRMVVAGDFRQLGPIALSQSRAAFDWLHKDAFQLARISGNLNHPSLGMLTVQRRMHSGICEIINRHFYDNKLTTNVHPQKVQASALPPLPGKPAILVSLLPDDGSLVEPTENGSRRNQASAKLAPDLAGKYVRSNAGIQVGLITPYRAQVSLLKRLVREKNFPSSQADRLKIGTVHVFQGGEADVIIWDLADTRHHPVGKLYRDEIGNRLANVAISRAQGKLVLIGDPETFQSASGYQAVGRLRNILTLRFSGSDGNVIRAKDLGLS